MKDTLSVERLSRVHPLLQRRVEKFFNILEMKGMYPRIVQGYRTKLEQDALYAQGRTRPGKIVTNARGGQSYHNFGYAIDIAFIKPNGSINFEVTDEVGQIGRSCGLEWGGTWATFKDRPHFQLPLLPADITTTTAKDLNKIVSDMEKRETIQVVSTWAKEGVEHAKKFGISNWTNPQTMVGTEELWNMMKKYGHIEEEEPTIITKEAFATWVHRLFLSL